MAFSERAVCVVINGFAQGKVLLEFRAELGGFPRASRGGEALE